MTNTSNIMPIIGGIVVLGVVGWYAFYAADTAGLNAKSGNATVVGKEHKPAGQTYRTENIGGRTRTIPQATPEMYLVKLRIGSAESTLPVERALYDALSNGEQIPVTYQQRRITGSIDIVEVNRQ